MNTIRATQNPDEELADILSRCSFVPRVGTRRFGPRFAIELSSRSPLRDRTGDLRLRIVPLVPLVSTGESFLEMVKDAHREMIGHSNRGIASFAQTELDRLSGEKLPADVLDRRRITLRQDDKTHTAETNEDGEALFAGIELDRECSFSLAEASAADATPNNIIHVVFTVVRQTRADYEQAYASSIKAAAAASRIACESAPSLYAPTEKKRYSHTVDGANLEATLVPTEDGKSLLEICTDSRRLKNAPVHYRVAGLEGELRLQSHEGLQKAAARLEVDYATAIASDPEFQIFWITD